MTLSSFLEGTTIGEKVETIVDAMFEFNKEVEGEILNFNGLFKDKQIMKKKLV